MKQTTDYLTLDFDVNSEAAIDLFSRLSQELRQKTIGLTPVHSKDGLPPLLTNSMTSWYKYFVQPERTHILDGIIQEVENSGTQRNSRILIPELERDRIEFEKFEAIQTERNTFLQRKDAADIYFELEDKSEQYKAMKSDAGRDAQRPTPALYWIVMVLFLIPEFLINWESFSKIPVLQNTPALVLGLVALVAVFFVFSSHRIGMMLKQRQDRFGGGVSATERWKSRWEIAQGLMLFSIGMGIVCWGRYLLLSDIIREKSILTGEGFGTEEFLTVGGALLGNIGAWILGIVWSFVKHDAIPNFSELRTEVSALRTKMRNIYSKHLTSRIQRHLLAAQQRVDQLNRNSRSQPKKGGAPQDLRSIFNSIRQKDSEVLALLEEYRSRLINTIKSENLETVFLLDNISKADMDIQEEMSADAYGRSALQLRYI